MKNKIKAIEDFDINIIDKVLVFLVFSGYKPAAEVYIIRRKQDEFIQLLNDLGLFYAKYYNDFFISVEEEISKDLKNCFLKKGNIRENEFKIGKYLGFPYTATQAYLGDIPRINEELRDSFNCSSLVLLMGFVLSEKHFKEEMRATTFVWYRAIRDLSPKIFSEIKQCGTRGREELLAIRSLYKKRKENNEIVTINNTDIPIKQIAEIIKKDIKKYCTNNGYLCIFKDLSHGRFKIIVDNEIDFGIEILIINLHPLQIDPIGVSYLSCDIQELEKILEIIYGYDQCLN